MEMGLALRRVSVCWTETPLRRASAEFTLGMENYCWKVRKNLIRLSGEKTD